VVGQAIKTATAGILKTLVVEVDFSEKKTFGSKKSFFEHPKA
jgi:hypothetical protein